jgi:hypothetical protein
MSARTVSQTPKSEFPFIHMGGGPSEPAMVNIVCMLNNHSVSARPAPPPRQTDPKACKTFRTRLMRFEGAVFTFHGRKGSTLEIEIVYNLYRMRRSYTKNRMRRLMSMGPPNFAIQGTYKSGLDR